ncbi:hypothetical protein HAX54_033333 [Datura stramonium]|uniref:Uncharacterized protein n=1 Tax=Datura stramonium TaxID=4076 RepID=A0ABS8SDF8_DATST|nr:hypothetical protein [Datura stramonium]
MLTMGTTTGDMLPDCIIHILLSHLGYKEAARMSILSKTWLRAWLTHPNLEFRVYDFKCVKIVDGILERYRVGEIPIEKFNFTISATLLEGLFMIDKWLGVALQNGVKYVEFGCTDFLPSVLLDDSMLQTLLISCPMIVSFTIKHCIGLEKIELRNLQKIKMVSVHMDKEPPVEIQAPTLEQFFYCGLAEQTLKLEMGACQNLKSLKLSCVKVSDGFLEHLTSGCQFLESLMLDNIFSKELKKFKVCRSQSLKKLEIRGCNGVAVIEAPNLESLEYVGYQIPVLKTAKTFGPLKHSRMELYRLSNLNALWFCKLRKFLFNSNSLSHITLHFPNSIKIDMENWDPYRGIFAIPQVDVLNVHLAWPLKCQIFVDVLLWSCHPRRLNLFSTVQIITCFRNHLMRVNCSSPCTSQGSKPWQCQLKDARVLEFYGQDLSQKPVEHNERSRICFSLDWK